MPRTTSHRFMHRGARKVPRLAAGTLVVGMAAAAFLMVAGPSEAVVSVGGLLPATPAAMVRQVDAGTTAEAARTAGLEPAQR